MNNDYMFEDEIDEEAAAELERQKAAEATRQDTINNTDNNTDSYSNNNSDTYNSSNTYRPNSYYQSQSGQGQQVNYQFDSQNGGRSGKNTGTGLATASLVLGIISLVFFCSCFNLITGVLAIIFGIIYLSSYDLQQGKARAIAGIVTAAISIILLFAGFKMIGGNSNLSELAEDEYFQYFYNDFYGNGINEDLFEDGDYLDNYLDNQDNTF